MKDIIDAARILGWWCSVNGDTRTRCLTKVARELLLQETILVRGHVRRIYGRPVGAGVYEMWLEDVAQPVKPPEVKK